MNPNLQKNCTGLNRIWSAFGNSISGLQAAWNEQAFRQEAILSLFLIPAAFFIGQTWLETASLIGCVVLVMVVELLNTGIESAIDRIGPEWHELSKRAKDIGSAAVLMSLLISIVFWVAAIYSRIYSHS